MDWPDARKAFKTLFGKTKADERSELWQVFRAGVERYRDYLLATGQWTPGRGGIRSRFTKQPGPWIRAEGWTDEYEIPKNGAMRHGSPSRAARMGL